MDLLGLLGRVAPPGMALGLRARAERAVSGQCAAGRGAPSPYRGALVPPLGRDATHNKTRPTRSASPGTASSKRRRGAGGARGKRAHLGGSEGPADGPSGEPRTGAGCSPRREPGGADEERACPGRHFLYRLCPGSNPLGSGSQAETGLRPRDKTSTTSGSGIPCSVESFCSQGAFGEGTKYRGVEKNAHTEISPSAPRPWMDVRLLTALQVLQVP